MTRANDKAIGFDMDGVIVDNTANKILLAKKFGIDLKPEETVAARIHKVIPDNIMSQIRPLLYDDPEMALTALLVRGAKDGLLRVKESGRPYFLISRRGNPAMAIKLLEGHGIWPAIFNPENAFFVREPEEKNEHAVRLGIDRYVDDEPSVLEKLEDVPNRFLFDQFRQFGELSFSHKKIHSWDELLAEFL